MLEATEMMTICWTAIGDDDNGLVEHRVSLAGQGAEAWLESSVTHVALEERHRELRRHRGERGSLRRGPLDGI